MNVLLVEPDYKNKYPPLGLMKISTYHKSLGDVVHFVKGISFKFDKILWDRIYITTLFTFDFSICIKTIMHYMHRVKDIESLYVGGILASLMPDKIVQSTGINRSQIIVGLLTNSSFVGDTNNINIDQLPLDYDILEEISYKYPAGDNYFSYTTRGCPNRCSFCAVPILEPKFIVTNSIINQIKLVDQKYGPKKDLLLLDNNVLNAPNFESIVDDLCKAGFSRGAKFEDVGDYHIVLMRFKKGDRGDFLNRRMSQYLNSFKKRIKSTKLLDTFLTILIDSEDAEDFAEFILANEYILTPIIDKYRSRTKKSRFLDFNQGIDARKVDLHKMKQLSRLSIKPLRLAFDDLHLADKYSNAVRLAHVCGIDNISNYILFNYKDKPEDLYIRLRINIELNIELGIQIFSFPMKYSPISRTDRDYVGIYWTKKALRAISAILQVTKGIVASGSDFFFKAFGSNLDEYNEILAMPRDFIIYRFHFENNGLAAEWKSLYRNLSLEQKDTLMNFVSHNVSDFDQLHQPSFIQKILPYYRIKFDGKETTDSKQLNLSFDDDYQLDIAI